jgi:hypothetical protein
MPAEAVPVNPKVSATNDSADTIEKTKSLSRVIVETSRRCV